MSSHGLAEETATQFICICGQAFPTEEVWILHLKADKPDFAFTRFSAIRKICELLDSGRIAFTVTPLDAGRGGFTIREETHA